jgi:hypothetical protein
LLFRAAFAATAIVPCPLGLQAVAGQAASAAAVPSVTSVSPSSGVDTGGTTVTISGSGFTGATAVMFGTGAETFTVDSDTEITTDASTPSGGDGTVDVTVTTPDGTSPTTPADQFTFVPAPTVTGVSPGVGPVAGGNTVTITGTGFTGATAVLFDQTEATSFTVDSDTQLTAIAPPGTAGTVNVLVCNGASTSPASTADQYTYQAPSCTTTVTGTHAGQLTVASGLTCLVNATQNGQVTVAAGAALSVTNSTVDGTATATSPVTVTGLQQNGTLTLENDSDGITLDGSQVNGLVYVENNSSPLTAGIMVSGNTVTGSLYCTGNNPAPLDYGAVNTVSGTASDQCAPIAQR